MALFGKRPARGKMAYVPGWLTEAKLPRVAEATRSVLKDLGVPFVTVPVSSGWELWFAGHEEEFNAHMEATLAQLRTSGATRVVTADPYEAHCFRERYGLECSHILEVYAEHLVKIRKGEERRSAYHHPRILQRLGVQPRAAQRILGRAGLIVPLEGPSALPSADFSRNDPALAREAARRLARRLGESIVTCSPQDHLLLQRHAKVQDVSEVLDV